MANQIDNLTLNDDTTGFIRTVNVASDDLFLSVDLTLQSGAVFEADNIKRGSGSPQGSVAGNEGDLFLRTDASTGRLYVNTDGTVNGWEETVIPSTLVQPGVNSVVLVSGSTATAYGTISAALAASIAGDTVVLGPGSFAESFTIPTQVRVQGAYGAGRSQITGTAATGVRITLSDESSLFQVLVTQPTNAVAAIAYSSAGQARVSDVLLQGTGGFGHGVENSGAGTLTVDRTQYVGGAGNTIFRQASGGGEMRLTRCLIDAGTISNGILVNSGSLRFQDVSILSGATTTTGLSVGAATVTGDVLDIEGPTTAVSITANGHNISFRSGRTNGGTLDFNVNPAVTTGTLHVLNFEASRNKFSVPGAYLANADVVISYQDDNDISDNAYRFISELAVGIPERGRESVFGEGDSYSRGMVVFTTDSTASSVSDGGNFINVSAAAASPTGSTFSFQGTAANHTILVGSVLSDGVDVLKHWGWKIANTTATSGGTYVFEIWDGAAWVEIGAMATHSSLFHRYANTFFLRANSSEHVRFGIEDDTTWATKTINTVTAYWARVRIESAATTVPVFQQFKLSTNRTELNEDGTKTAHGRARSRKTVVSSGNIFGESGGVTSGTLLVGAGGLPTGWAHNIKNSILNGNGDAVYFQFNLPRGIDTSFPLRLVVTYVTNTNTTPVQMIWSFLGQASSGVLVADPAGGITPVPRSDANTPTLTSTAGQAITFNLPQTSINKSHTSTQDGFDISELYEGDMGFVRLELDDDGPGNTDVLVLSVEIDAVFWTEGEKL